MGRYLPVLISIKEANEFPAYLHLQGMKGHLFITWHFHAHDFTRVKTGMLSYPQSSIWKAGTGEREIKNCDLLGVAQFTAKSTTCTRLEATNWQERAISGIKLFPNVQLIKWLVD